MALQHRHGLPLLIAGIGMIVLMLISGQIGAPDFLRGFFLGIGIMLEVAAIAALVIHAKARS